MAKEPKSKESKSICAFVLRLPVDLHKKLKAQADTDRRSINQEVIVILEKALEHASR